jgi:Leucine-rich repeat (LRR) protein
MPTYVFTYPEFLVRVLFIAGVLITISAASGIAQFSSDIIYKENGRLTYVSDYEGNRIPDFSHAGYRGGGVALPEIPVVITLEPQDGDDSNRIQAALDEVGSMEKNEYGIRGAVKLKPGRYSISSNIYVRHSGVVLRGSGDNDNPETATIIKAAKSIQGAVLQLNGGTVEEWNRPSVSTLQSETNITTDFVPVGSRTFEVEDASGFKVGDNIIVLHRATEEWLQAVDYGATHTAPPWTVDRRLNITYNRYITGISGNLVSIDAPVYNHLDRNLSQSVIFKANRNNLITEVGIEDLRLVIETDGEFTENHPRHALMFDGVENGWARGVTVMHFSFTGIGTVRSTFVTIKDSRALEPHSLLTGSRRYNFNTWELSNNILFENVLASNSRHCFISNGMASVSGVVFTNSTSYRTTSLSEGHRMWSQALLFEKISFVEPQTTNVMGHYNRGSGGSGHGWASAHSVAWNNDAPGRRIYIEKPPTSQNYGIGNRAIVAGTGPYGHLSGYIEGTNQVPEFESLYQTQLEERLVHGAASDAPARLTATPNVDLEHITLQWGHTSLKDGKFEIERSNDFGESFTEIAVIDSDKTSYLDDEINGFSHVYRVRASDASGKSVWSNMARPPQDTTAFKLDSLALVAIYHNTVGSEWKNNQGWLEAPLNASNAWKGVTLAMKQGELRVQMLNLEDNNLNGEVPEELNNLTALELLNLRSNQLTGSIPNVSNLVAMEELWLESNAFTGTIPDGITKMANLKKLMIGNNTLIGKIPDLSGLTNLTDLHINDIETLEPGPVPDWIQNSASSLQRIRLENSNRIGELPSWVSELSNLRLLTLYRNELEGDIPLIGNPEVLERLELWANNFSGSISPGWGEYTRLFNFRLQSNNLSGELPSELSEMTALSVFRVAWNPDLTGSIPMTYLAWPNISQFDYNSTGLCEPDEQAFHDWISTISSNGTGTVCAQEPTSAKEVSDLPEEIKLHQNYPNPFNPAATIAYDVPDLAHVRLAVYNVLGQHIATLVNEEKKAGRYKVHFDASQLSSGTYIYRLEAGEKSVIQSMSLIK